MVEAGLVPVVPNMINLYEAVRTNPSYDRLEIGDFLFARYTCGVGDEKLGIWADTDYLVNVVTGKKTWYTADAVWVAEPADTVYFTTGAAILNPHFEVDFCLLMFCSPRQPGQNHTVREIAGSLDPVSRGVAPDKSAVRVENDTALSAFFQSMLTYFSGKEKPSEPLLRLKLKELIIGVLTSGKNPALANYFWTMVTVMCVLRAAEIMEANFLDSIFPSRNMRSCAIVVFPFVQARFSNALSGSARQVALCRKRLDRLCRRQAAVTPG